MNKNSHLTYNKFAFALNLTPKFLNTLASL